MQATPHVGEALIAAPWPSAEAAVDGAADAQFEALQAAVRAVRNARAEYGVEPGRKIAATVRCGGEGARGGAPTLRLGPPPQPGLPLVAVPWMRLTLNPLHGPPGRVDDAELRAALQAEAPVLALLAKLDAEQARAALHAPITLPRMLQRPRVAPALHAARCLLSLLAARLGRAPPSLLFKILTRTPLEAPTLPPPPFPPCSALSS